VNVFAHTEPSVGTDKSRESGPKGEVTVWNHFHALLPSTYVVSKADIGTYLGKKRSSYDVFKRALDEITTDAVETVLDLIAQNTLYRGAEFKPLIEKLNQMKDAYGKFVGTKEEQFVWLHVAKESPALLHIRNSAIGTLLVNLSEGMDLEAAVRAYETVTAPANYERPTALVTKAMVERAKKDLEALGLVTALERRHAVLADVSVNDVLFADRSARKVMKGVFDEVATKVPTPKKLDKVEEMPVEAFIKDVLPKVTGIEVFMEREHEAHLVSLIAPQHKDAGLLFKWPNAFSWSYNGEVADSIKERVKAAGGNVTGDLCCRLAWGNEDDLDFHMVEPNGHVIYYGYRRRLSPNGGMLDVDANGADGVRDNPVENIFYEDRRKMMKGTYSLYVHQFNRRSALNPGYEVEIDFLGTVYHFASATMPRANQKVRIAEMHWDGKELTFTNALDRKTAPTKEVWGVKRGDWNRVNVMMLSPNHWDGAGDVGNKHYFFMLDGCANDGTARGFYNEFLMPVVNEHRKVLEIVGSKTKPVPAAEQLSGLGFSSTKRASILARLTGSFTRTVKIVF